MEQGTGELEERFEALQDEVNLLKNQIKQTLVDLREFMVKERTVAPQVPWVVQGAAAQPTGQDASAADQLPEGQQLSPSAQGVSNPRVPGFRNPAPHPRDVQGQAYTTGALDVSMLGNIIWWLGTVKRRGLSLQHISPFLEAYEMAGHLMPSTSKIILRSMADLDQLEEIPPDQPYSSQDYSECLRQLHDIICPPEYTDDSLASPPGI